MDGGESIVFAYVAVCKRQGKYENDWRFGVSPETGRQNRLGKS